MSQGRDKPQTPAAQAESLQTGPLPGQFADPAGTDRTGYEAQDRLLTPAIIAAILFAAVTAIATGFLA